MRYAVVSEFSRRYDTCNIDDLVHTGYYDTSATSGMK